MSGEGVAARWPTQIPLRMWRQVFGRALRKVVDNNLPLLAAGVAFFGFLALFPGLIALVTLVGLVADPTRLTEQLQSFTSGLPDAAEQLISQQIAMITEASGGALTIGLLVSLLGALWVASTGTSYLVMAVNLAYGESETRNFFQLRWVALLLTLGVLVFLALTLALIALVPIVLTLVPLDPIRAELIQVLRWLMLVVVIVVALAVLYRIAPDRSPAKIRWVTLGSLVAATLWLLASAGFSLYVNLFGRFNEIYGTLGGVIVFMLWLFLTSFVVLLGAQINAEVEHQTTCDTTVGVPKPMGQRGAVVADTTPAQRQ